MTAPRIAVDPWDPSYGTPMGEAAMEESTARLTLDFEVPRRPVGAAGPT